MGCRFEVLDVLTEVKPLTADQKLNGKRERLEKSTVASDDGLLLILCLEVLWTSMIVRYSRLSGSVGETRQTTSLTTSRILMNPDWTLPILFWGLSLCSGLEQC